MAGVRPLKYIEHFVAMNLGEVQEIPLRAKGPRGRFRGPGPSKCSLVYRRKYSVACILKTHTGTTFQNYPLSLDLTRHQARKLLRRVRLTVPQARIWTGQGVR